MTTRDAAPIARIPADVLATPCEGHNLSPAPLAEHLGTTATLLVFLRHLG
jgi:hypothetical protein